MHRPAFTPPETGTWQPAPPPVTPLRRWLARCLRRSGAALRLTAHRLTRPALAARPVHVPMTLPQLEFHADAGAPEGALYVDGEYVGRLDVRRL
jgi:hypothetical protein